MGFWRTPSSENIAHLIGEYKGLDKVANRYLLETLKGVQGCPQKLKLQKDIRNL